MSNLINSNAFNSIPTSEKIIFYRDITYIDNEHDFCSDRSNPPICRGSAKEGFNINRTQDISITESIKSIPHSKCEDEDTVFKVILDNYAGGAMKEHIKNLIYEQTMNSLDLPNGPYDKKAWIESKTPGSNQPVHIHIVFSKISIDGKSAFSKDTRLLIMDIFANSIPDFYTPVPVVSRVFGELIQRQTQFTPSTIQALNRSKVYSIDASCIDFKELLKSSDLSASSDLPNFVHLNDGATKFDSATKSMPDQTMSSVTLSRNEVTLISANISPLIIKRTNNGDIKWKILFNRFSYCCIDMSTPDNGEIYNFVWDDTIPESVRSNYQTYMLIHPNCFMYAVSVKNNKDVFDTDENNGYTLLLKGTKGILIKTEGKMGKTTSPIGSISVATLSQIYLPKDKSDVTYGHFTNMVKHLYSDILPSMNPSQIESNIKKLTLDFKRGGDQNAIMSIKQINDITNHKVAYISLDRIAYTYSKVLGLCTSIRVGVGGAYFEEPDGDVPDGNVNNGGINYITECGHNYNLWIHRTESITPISPEEIFNRTVANSKILLGEIAKYISERFNNSRELNIDNLLSNFKRFTDSSIIYIKAEYPPHSFHEIVHNFIVLFTLLINVNVYYISILLLKISELSGYFTTDHGIGEKVEFKSKLEILDELYNKLKKSYLELPNNLIDKMNEKINVYFRDLDKSSKRNAYTYRYFELILESMTDTLKGDNMEANYGVLLHRLINDNDKTLPSLKDYTIYLGELLPRYRGEEKPKPVNIMCTHILNSIKIIARSIYGTVFKNIDKIQSIDNSELVEKIERMKVLFSDITSGETDTDFRRKLNVIINTLITDIQTKLMPNITIISINEKSYTSIYNNYHGKSPSPSPSPSPSTTTQYMRIEPATIKIPDIDILVNINDIIKLAKDTSMTDTFIDAMNIFIHTYAPGGKIPTPISVFVNELGEQIAAYNVLNNDWTITIDKFSKPICPNMSTVTSNLAKVSALCTITSINLIDAFNDPDYHNKVNEFYTAKTIHPSKADATTRNNLISFAIINQLLKISGNKYIETQYKAGGSSGFDKIKSNTSYILNTEYVLSLSLAKNYFKEFHWRNRLIIARQFLDSTMRFYDDTEFVNTIQLINITHKYCSDVLDTYDLISYEPLNTVLVNKLNPAIFQILYLYVSQIYLPSFTTARKLAVTFFPNDIIKMFKDNAVSSRSQMNVTKLGSSSRRKSSSDIRKTIKGIRKSNSYTRRSNSDIRKLSSFGRKKNISIRRANSTPGFYYSKRSSNENNGFFSPLESNSINIIDSANSIQESIETRMDIIKQPDEYNIEKLYINFTSELYSCGELATVYIDEQFCNIPQYIETFQVEYMLKKTQQVIVPEITSTYYALIPFHVMPDKSFILKKPIDFENVYNLIQLFKLFKYNPLNSNINTNNEQLGMFNLENKLMFANIVKLSGINITTDEALLRIASFIDEIQYYALKQLKRMSPEIVKSDKGHISGGRIPKPESVYSSKSLSSIKNENHFMFITPELKLYVIIVETGSNLSVYSSYNMITKSTNTQLSEIEFENTIDIKGCLLRSTDIFAGMIIDRQIPPYKIETIEIHNFS